MKTLKNRHCYIARIIKSTINPKTKTTTRKHGGEVIGSGGYGCVFRPALKCKDLPRESNKITKLMKEKYTKREYSEIMKFLPMLKKIPNFQKYFLVQNITTCSPDKLTKKDLKKFTSKCSALKKINVTKKNINNRLSELKSMNLPDGGMDVGDYVVAGKSVSDLNKQLIELLTN